METNHPVTSRIRHPRQTPKAKRKAESWERSVGTLGSRPQLSGLVVKKTGLDTSIRRGRAPPLPGRFSPLAACSASGSHWVVLFC